jgi:hypothetical protein
MKEPAMDQDTAQPNETSSAVTAAHPTTAPDPAATSAPVVTAAASRRTNGSRILNIVLGIAIALAIGGVGFASGRLTAPAAAFPNGLGPGGQVFNGNGRPGGQGAQGGLFSGGLTIEGTVESVSATTMTIKTASGKTIQFAIDGTTTYHAQTDATSSEVATGGKVIVRLDVGSFRGGPNASGGPDGGSTARDVTVVP